MSLFIYYLLAYLFRDIVCVQTVTSNGRKTGDYGIGQEVAGGRRGVHRYLILLRHWGRALKCWSGQPMPTKYLNGACWN